MPEQLPGTSHGACAGAPGYGNIVEFPLAEEERLVSALEWLGYKSVRDDELLMEAQG